MFWKPASYYTILRHFQIWGTLLSMGFPGWESRAVVSIAQLQCSGQPAPRCSTPEQGRAAPHTRHSNVTLSWWGQALPWGTSLLFTKADRIFFFFSGFFSCLAGFWNQPRWLGDSAVEAFPILCSLPSGDPRWAADTAPCDEHTPYLQSPTCTEQLYTPYSRNF